MKCLKDRCWSPVACGGFGYCRDRNNDGYPMDEVNVRRRRKEACEHDWKIWPETDGQSQRCMKCGDYRNTPANIHEVPRDAP